MTESPRNREDILSRFEILQVFSSAFDTLGLSLSGFKMLLRFTTTTCWISDNQQ